VYISRGVAMCQVGVPKECTRRRVQQGTQHLWCTDDTQVSIRFLSHPPSPRRIRLTQHSVCLVESEYYTDIVSVPESSDDMCELVSVFMDTYMSACSLGGDIYVCTNRFRIITFTLMDQWNLCIV
jgi:hypothetical protein